MCGLVGFFDRERIATKEILQQMGGQIVHRGPDSCGSFFMAVEGGNLGLGHQRLSILDLTDRGAQPYKFRNLIISYNGEIYNFREIRDELESFGYEFSSDTDTEVVAKAFDMWGIDSLNRFNGMFAIAIFDSNKKKIFLIRDRAGIKPLYVFLRNGFFSFASEIKAFSVLPNFDRTISAEALKLFLRYGYIPQPHSIFKSVEKVPPGSVLTFDIMSAQMKAQTYWKIPCGASDEMSTISKDDAINELDSLLESACNYRMIADVPVGIFLSGGYDSSLVTAMVQKGRSLPVKTFTVGFDDKQYDESDAAARVADYLGTDHSTFMFSDSDALKIIPSLPLAWDEPFADPSALPSLFLSQLVRPDVKVILSADGGDEVFGGYNKYTKLLQIHRYLSYIPCRQRVSTLADWFCKAFRSQSGLTSNFARKLENVCAHISTKNISQMLAIYESSFSSPEIDVMFRGAHQCLSETPYIGSDHNLPDKISSLSQLLALDYNTYLTDDILVKTDRATMFSSLEGREPLLDFRLVEFMSTLPDNFKINGADKKHLFKLVTHQYVPKEILDRPKKGFGIPLNRWLRKELREFALDIIRSKSVIMDEYLDRDFVLQIFDDFIAGRNNNVNRLWRIIVLLLWEKQWIAPRV